MAKAIPCPCNDTICKNWVVSPQAAFQGVRFTKEQAEAVADLLNRERASPYERIAQVQKDLFGIREDMCDTIDDQTDSRFMRLCAEIGTLAEDFAPDPAIHSRIKDSDAETLVDYDKLFCSDCPHARVIHNEQGCTHCKCGNQFNSANHLVGI